MTVWTVEQSNDVIEFTSPRRNPSGVTPLDLRVVVRPDPVETKTKGGIIIPDETKEREKYATVKGTLIAAGENAWEEAAAALPQFHPPSARRPHHDRQIWRHPLQGHDGDDYRIMNDEDVIARLEE
jgi:chaperonin GroES